MPRPKNLETIVDELTASLDEALNSVEELRSKATSEIPREEVDVLKKTLESCRIKVPRLQRLIQAFSEKSSFVVVSAEGSPRRATADEARRIIMHYQRLKKGEDVIGFIRRVNETVQKIFEDELAKYDVALDQRY